LNSISFPVSAFSSRGACCGKREDEAREGRGGVSRVWNGLSDRHYPMPGPEKRMPGLDGLEKKCIISTVQFEYDPEKSASNLKKHGICFEIAKELWLGKTVEGPAKSVSEARSFAIGRVGRKFWTVIHTTRGKRTRITSARRSTKNEIEFYTRTDETDDSREPRGEI
jgi:hypothetical protein